MKNKTIKILSFLILMVLIITNISPIFALSYHDSQIITLEKDHDCISLLKIQGKDMLKAVVYVVYRDPATGRKQPAFCIEHEKEGIGTGAGDSYEVTLNLMRDERLWRALYKGYMGSSYLDWGLECDDDLYYATKTAVHCLSDGSTPKGKYEVPNRVGWGENVSLEEVQRRATKVLDVAQQLYNYAVNGTEEYMEPTITANKEATEREETINQTNYLVQSYKVTANREIETYNVAINNFPEGTKILNSLNEETNTMSNNIFKIAIPVENIRSNTTGYVSITDAKVKTYPVFYARAYDEENQDYITYADSVENASTVTERKIDAYKSGLEIIKKDKETGERLEGVTFNIKYADNNEDIGDFTTDSNGTITINKLRQGKIVITEKNTKEEYILDTTPIKTDLKYNSVVKVDVDNIHKKGNVKVFKVDKDNNKITLGNVKFDLYSVEFDKVIGTYATDENGEINIENLRTGDYKLIEKETNKWYDLTDDTEIRVEWDTTINTIIENELKKGQIKVIKVDKENNEVKIPGVTFEVLDEEGNVLEKITTDENGEAITKKYSIRDYEKLILREIETDERYVLNDKPQTVELEANQIKTITFENEKIKGKVEITKVDKNDSSKKIEGAKFGLYNDEDELIDTLITNKEGIATSKDLYKGNYYLKELDTGSVYYLLNQETFEFEIKNNGETIPIVIDNEGTDIKVNVYKEGTIEIAPGDNVNYTFSNIANNSNIYLDNFKWIDYIPTDFIRLQSMTTGTWNQDLNYIVYYKTNKTDEYFVFKDGLNTKENNTLDFTMLNLADDEYIVEIMFDFGKVEKGFREDICPTMTCKSLDTLEDGETFTNHTKTVGIYYGVTAEANSKWTTIVHKPEENHETTLPRTGK